jgi:hypothetical protein
LRPLAIDLCCGLTGWGEGLIAEGWDVIGYDIEDMFAKFGQCQPEHFELRVRDILTINGSELANADLIVASPPCQEFSYLAMPWKRGKQIARALRGQDEFPQGYTGSRTVADLTRLFDAAVRIGREAGVPTVIENVRGAQEWIGRSRWAYGSYHLWGDVPALMPMTLKRVMKVQSLDGGRRTDPGKGARFTSRDCGDEAIKCGGTDLGEKGFNVQATERYGHLVDGADYARTPDDRRQHIGVKRKFASAMIAKIPLALARHIARVYRPTIEVTE